ncbi:DUF637 domain-containing protein [Azoarcus taiwanensis]|uniref:DUF637 domain-containing protein n=1 Tax=Azoarcus taiwanensis TaxID=666964 RepID=A0A972F8H1_9RHOO|nr:DUF637 domain-containing protein [Azoarcus taiwanensis]NMG03867.1 hypothetical protein [Azoarcus taiwanensis]
MRSESLILRATTIHTPGDAQLAAQGDIVLEAAYDTYSLDARSYRKSSGLFSSNKRTSREIAERATPTGVDIQAGNIDIAAGGDLSATAARLISHADTTLSAGGELELLAALNTDAYSFERNRSGDFGRRSQRSALDHSIEHVGTTIAAGGDIAIDSGSNQTWQAASLSADGAIDIRAGGAIDFEGVKDFEQHARHKSSSDWAWRKAKGEGYSQETLRLTEIAATSGLVIEAAERIRIDVPRVTAESVANTIARLAAAEPQLAWLADLHASGDIDWRQVREHHDRFKYSDSGMGPGLALAVAIVTTVATGGWGNAIAAHVGTTYGPAAGYAAHQGARAVLSASVDTALHGGSLEDRLAAALTQQAIHVVSATAFNQVGNLGLADGSLEKILVKALVGGAISQAATGDFASGALAAGANEALVTQLAQLSGNDPTLLVLASRLVGTVSAALSGGDPAQAADIAGYGTQYNYLNHVRPSLLALSEKERFEAAAVACEAGDSSACRTRNELVLLSQERDQAIAQACLTDRTLCNTLTREAREMGNVVYRDAGFVWANSPDPTFALNLATMGPSQPNPALAESWHYRQAQDLSDGLLITGTSTTVGLLGRGGALGGAALAGGFDAAGQLFRIINDSQDEYRFMQTLFAMGTGYALVPLAPRLGPPLIGNTVIGGTIGGANTGLNNWWYGEDESIRNGVFMGAGLGALGTTLGGVARHSTTIIAPARVGGQPLDRSSPALLQNLGIRNPWPDYVGIAVEESISNIDSFVDLNPSKAGDRP